MHLLLLIVKLKCLLKTHGGTYAQVAIFLPRRNVELVAVVVIYCMSQSFLITLTTSEPAPS